MRWLLPAIAMVLALSCFDPLYEVSPGATWSACCRNGEIDTCECDDTNACSFDILACAGGTCVESGACGGETGGGQGGGSAASGGGTSSSGGGSAAAGGGNGGGSAGSDGGTPPHDGGTPPQDAGMPPHDAGIVIENDAGPPLVKFELCCPMDTNMLTSCACPASGCTGAPYTACAGGACEPGSDARCPE